MSSAAAAARRTCPPVPVKLPSRASRSTGVIPLCSGPMEAAVLTHNAMPELDCNSNTVNAELEVKKLQELVRKLERQNKQLRTRCSSPTSACTLGTAGGYRLSSPLPTLLCRSSLGSLSPPKEPFDYFHSGGDEDEDEEDDGYEPSALDELELLDLDSLCCSDESDETWLYVPSKARESRDDHLPPLQWCRRLLDSPKSEVEAARRSLSLRLEQAPCLSSPLHPVLHRALSPVGLDLSPASERTPTFFPANRSRSLRYSGLSPQSSMDGGLEDDSIALGYKLQDLTDVQVMARLQEESLRQDYASTSSLLANRHSQSFSFQLSAGPGLDEEDEEEEDDEDYGLLPPPQPRFTRLQHSHTFTSIRDWRRSSSSLSTPPSTPSTPPYPSAGFAFQTLVPGPGPGLGSLYAAEPLGFRPGSDKLRRSMPNLVRAPSMPSAPSPPHPSASPSLLRNSQSFDSSSGLARLQSSIPSQLQNRVQSVGNFSTLSRKPLKATAYVSPTIKGSASVPTPAAGPQCLNIGGGSGIPMLGKAPDGGGTPGSTPNTPRRSLPRPVSFVGSTPRSKAGQQSRSLLTPPKSLSTLSALRDSNWRDGCY
ncbi:SLAIN motif-containing protein 1-like isoform X2 [Pseudoliparis swirei]|uniref:SLAIN motif-containing protein 1-like isoform X2 n=1 Tax=Pseudoliparis swirei TaxID=2059687 RepID=UPI0024BE4DFA|nr:SLAIN motif-containing protein 1-like isoform X2 [Pseudoliparis swirei]